MRKSCLSLAVVGCGLWGMNHLRVWEELGCLRVVCDMDPTRLEAVRSRYPEADVCSDVRAVLDRPDIAAVVIATPAPTHATLVL